MLDRPIGQSGHHKDLSMLVGPKETDFIHKRRHRKIRRYCHHRQFPYLCIAIYMMALLFARLPIVARAWMAQQRGSLTSAFRGSSIIGSGHPSVGGIGGGRRSFQSSSQMMLAKRKFSIGDAVVIQIDKEQQSGIIQEIRGAGWYTVLLFQTEAIVKCRSTQLVGRLKDTIPDMDVDKTIQTFSPANLSRPILHPDAGQKPNFPPPPPTIYDLDAAVLDRTNVTNGRDRELLKQVQHHLAYDRWVVFTDLHCSPASLETCLQVLSRVHELALERNAGVLFLGDFWHHRGTLRVDCLNSVLEHFREWTVPMLMIPGNHDQVTLDGHNHGLTPFENAYRVGDVAGPLIFSYPSKFRNALFVPHIRNIATMESIIQSTMAQESSALFVHAEVTGAMMNDLIVALDGIPPASFPSNKHIYSGHFHKPHTVKSSKGGVQIEYLGSPYEVSLSEAQQQKTLAVLDADWDCIEYIPIDVGRRHFKVTTWEGLLELKLEGRATNCTLRSGDRIVATIPQVLMEGQSSEIQNHVKTLRSEGIAVEIREVKKSAEQAMGSNLVGGVANRLEEMTPESTWRAYLSEEEHERETIDAETSMLLVEAGLEILNELESSDEVKADQERQYTDLSLLRVSVEGFGPFREKAVYPLSNRGLVLLKGTNNDGGSDSNGSGKSSLAMAALWALTGSMDPRRAQDGKVSDIVHDDSKVARVTLDGTLNGRSFSISRSKTANKGALVFQLDGEDLTTQSVKETQSLIEEYLGVSIPILSRTMFHGQHSINELLEATDAKLKEELSLLVPMKLWQTAASTARTKGRSAGKKSSELEGMIAMREQDLDRLATKLEQAENVMKEKELKVAKLETQYEDQKIIVKDEQFHVDFSECESMVKTLETRIQSLAEELSSCKEKLENELATLQTKLIAAQSDFDVIYQLVQQDEREEYAANLDVKLAMERVLEVEKKWSISLESDSAGLSTPDLCPTCRQPIGDGHSHEALELQMTKEVHDSTSKSEDSRMNADAIAKRLEDRRADLKRQDEEKNTIERDLNMIKLKWQSKVDQLEESLEEKRRQRYSISERMTMAAKQSQASNKMEAALANIKMARADHEYAKQNFSTIQHEMNQVRSRLDEMYAELQSEKQDSRVMSELGERFGQRGVQTFVLQNVVDVLQACSQTYLDDLSDGSQRMDLSLDAGDRISRTAFVVGADGAYKERSLAALSGGQWRRCSLALTFGFAELVARRGKFRPSMCVLDEPLTHLDRSGRSKVGDVIRKMLRPTDSDKTGGFGMMGMSTVLIILQDLAAEELDEAFDYIDEVVKEDSASRVKVDGLYGM